MASLLEELRDVPGHYTPGFEERLRLRLREFVVLSDVTVLDTISTWMQLEPEREWHVPLAVILASLLRCKVDFWPETVSRLVVPLLSVKSARLLLSTTVAVEAFIIPAFSLLAVKEGSRTEYASMDSLLDFLLDVASDPLNRLQRVHGAYQTIFDIAATAISAVHGVLVVAESNMGSNAAHSYTVVVRERLFAALIEAWTRPKTTNLLLYANVTKSVVELIALSSTPDLLAQFLRYVQNYDSWPFFTAEERKLHFRFLSGEVRRRAKDDARYQCILSVIDTHPGLRPLQRHVVSNSFRKRPLPRLNVMLDEKRKRLLKGDVSALLSAFSVSDTWHGLLETELDFHMLPLTQPVKLWNPATLTDQEASLDPEPLCQWPTVLTEGPHMEVALPSAQTLEGFQSLAFEQIATKEHYAISEVDCLHYCGSVGTTELPPTVKSGLEFYMERRRLALRLMTSERPSTSRRLFRNYCREICRQLHPAVMLDDTSYGKVSDMALGALWDAFSALEPESSSLAFVPPSRSTNGNLDSATCRLLHVSMEQLASTPLHQAEVVECMLRCVAGCSLLLHGQQPVDEFFSGSLPDLQLSRVWMSMTSLTQKFGETAHLSNLLASWLMFGGEFVKGGALQLANAKTDPSLRVLVLLRSMASPTDSLPHLTTQDVVGLAPVVLCLLEIVDALGLHEPAWRAELSYVKDSLSRILPPFPQQLLVCSLGISLEGMLNVAVGILMADALASGGAFLTTLSDALDQLWGLVQGHEDLPAVKEQASPILSLLDAPHCRLGHVVGAVRDLLRETLRSKLSANSAWEQATNFATWPEWALEALLPAALEALIRLHDTYYTTDVLPPADEEVGVLNLVGVVLQKPALTTRLFRGIPGGAQVVVLRHVVATSPPSTASALLHAPLSCSLNAAQVLTVLLSFVGPAGSHDEFLQPQATATLLSLPPRWRSVIPNYPEPPAANVAPILDVLCVDHTALVVSFLKETVYWGAADDVLLQDASGEGRLMLNVFWSKPPSQPGVARLSPLLGRMLLLCALQPGGTAHQPLLAGVIPVLVRRQSWSHPALFKGVRACLLHVAAETTLPDTTSVPEVVGRLLLILGQLPPQYLPSFFEDLEQQAPGSRARLGVALRVLGVRDSSLVEVLMEYI
ncbi:MAG: hypothetical protein KVP17_001776 [Porospora cf. gigantea B]|uniref:uncharacterized protein n=1 Tax=Porospora cf. gigantea B TaxID=2853592 RepID=UPI003571CA24|nr:MAG: hypothetical protein KVP17_001776 [Porospora cf. gigantea B]